MGELAFRLSHGAQECTLEVGEGVRPAVGERPAQLQVVGQEPLWRLRVVAGCSRQAASRAATCDVALAKTPAAPIWGQA